MKLSFLSKPTNVPINKQSYLAHMQDLAQYLAQNSKRFKNINNQNSESQKHHQSEKSSATVIDESLTISALQTINTHHKHTSTISNQNSGGGHHKKTSSIQVDKNFVSYNYISGFKQKLIGEGFVASHNRISSKEESSVIINSSRRQSIFSQTSVIEKSKKLLSLIKELKCYAEYNTPKPISVIEELIESVNDIKTILDSGFEEVKLKSIEKFMLLQFAFYVFIFGRKHREDKKYLNTIKLVIDIIDQSNQIMINSIYDTMLPLEQASLTEQVSFY